jgi:hypothetical protein
LKIFEYCNWGEIFTEYFTRYVLLLFVSIPKTWWTMMDKKFKRKNGNENEKWKIRNVTSMENENLEEENGKWFKNYCWQKKDFLVLRTVNGEKKLVSVNKNIKVSPKIASSLVKIWPWTTSNLCYFDISFSLLIL